MKKRLQACFVEEGKNVENRSKRNRAIAEYFRRFPDEAGNQENGDELDEREQVDDDDEPNPGLIDIMDGEFGIDIVPRIRFDFGVALDGEAEAEPTMEPPLYPSDPEGDRMEFDEIPPQISLRKFATKK